ncbi:hypothetical protein F7018_11510 [Tenacibaculum aiptasiae]|uniref:Uncharacterized protein n=1 Tax=Tenacibaculum aiptasiae TaxID=426481 RepID=A0A7J5AG10_9FLAO|nr:hypothetical protein [Tenacibaculum aiptasiae]KAB1155929.1 hypothetical protein F7018_11510 [Tenacibaculum aiptasiae]
MKRLIILMLLITNSTFAQFSFSDLEYININSSYLNGKFGFKKNSKFKLINKFCNDSIDCYKYDLPTTLIGYWNVNDNIKIEFYYTEAPSDDPAFIAVYNGKIILEESGTTLHFKGNTIYIEGNANSYFDKKRKFQFIHNSYQEVNQPFYHIGVEGKLNYPIKIYKTDKFLEKVAYLPKGYEIEVLLGQTSGKYNDLEKVLIKTEFGLIGWFNFKEITFGKPLINGLHFHGD